jgi:MoaA/NifB/PqqE/SkfB family radical SAM enzyme
MKVLFLIVSTICDIACKDCFYTIGYEQRSPDRIRPEQAKDFAYKIAKNGFTSVILTGGDPLSSQFKHETYALVRELKAQNLRVLINTSAARLNEVDINTIINLSIDRVDISINSYIKEIHNFERGFFDDAAWTIKSLINNDYQSISTTTVITEENAIYAPDTLKWLISLGIKDVRYQPIFKLGDRQNYTKLEEAMKKCAEVCKKDHTEYYLAQCHAAYHKRDQQQSSICQMGKTYFVSDSLGNLSPCFHQTDTIFGNILTDSAELINANIETSRFSKYANQHCFGKHCVSLFDNPIFWR